MSICGPQTTVSVSNDTAATVATATSIYSGAGIVIGVLGKLGGISLPSWVPAIVLSAAAQTAIVIAAVAIATVAAIAQIYSDRCKTQSGIPNQCFSGIVNDIIPAFSTTTDAIFPFSSLHDRVDVVVRSVYFDELRQYGKSVYCINTVPTMSPVLIAFYHNAQVCAAGAGAVTGAVVGGIVGTLLGVAAYVALGCVSIIFCIFCLIVAALIALAAAIAGAVIASQAAKAATKSSGPTETSGNAEQQIHVGDIVTVIGNLISAGFLAGEAVLWWTTSTALIDTLETPPPFSTEMADAAFANGKVDSCLTSSNPPIM